MVTASTPAEAPTAPQRLRSVQYQRPVAHIKHSGTFGQIHYGLQAEHNGFDDALFVGDGSVVSESTIANIGCCSGNAVIWPDAPALHGITMQLLEQALPGAGLASRRATVRVPELGTFDAVFLANSLGIAPVGQVDDQVLRPSEAAMSALQDAYQRIPWEPI
jgi:branched-subunit amino acid aminotransferase/4-amino-4-deoxychorismate lyase